MAQGGTAWTSSPFDRLARTLALAGTRRATLGALLAGAGTALGFVRPALVVAQGGCKTNGTRCQDGADCCSGRCKPKRHTNKRIKVCRQADNQGVCTVEVNICSGNSTQCGTPSGGGPCFCFVTTKWRSFCGTTSDRTDICDCTSNEKCEQLIGKGAKCVSLGSSCAGCAPSTTSACFAPCPTLDPIP